MIEVPKHIYDYCPECKYGKSICDFGGETEDCGTHNEYLYICTKCGARIWVDEEWARTHEARER